ncbi:MAG: hypothetical protein ABR536_05265 [Solirubrobacterales bacterium]
MAPVSIAPAPKSSDPQHLQALARANQVRLARAALKRAIAGGAVSVAEVIVNAPWESQTMSISELLSSQHRWGRTRSRKFLSSLGLSENKRLDTLTQRQRELVATALQAREVEERAGDSRVAVAF